MEDESAHTPIREVVIDLSRKVTFSAAEMVSFLRSKHLVCIEPTRSVEEFVSALNTDPTLADARRRLDYLMELRTDTVRSVVPAWLHQFTAEEFSGYKNKNVIFAALPGSLVQRYQRQLLCYLQAVSVMQHYLLCLKSTDTTGTTGTMDLCSFVQSFSGRALHRHLTNRGKSSVEALKEVLLPGTTLKNVGFQQFPEYFHKYGPALVSDFQVTSDFKNRRRENRNKFYGHPESVVELNGEGNLEKHAMVAVGYRHDHDGKLFLLFQNWWSDRQFVEVDEDYYNGVGAMLHICATPQTKARSAYVMLEGTFMESAEELEQQETCMEDYYPSCVIDFST